jgi:putative ribosome biogenesis GTPase RsgA
VESRKDELIAKIRERRARLERTMATLDDRIAVIGEVKEKAMKTGRIVVIVIAVSTAALASLLLLRALSSRRWPRRRLR